MIQRIHYQRPQHSGYDSCYDEIHCPWSTPKSSVFRALLDSIFKRALSKYYSYGVRYLRKLDELAGNIQNWGEVPAHAAYLEEIRQAHQRKHSFWTRYEAAQKQG